ncbi:hypothetical protein B5S31_g3848 [[Candida] boidinii]|nr:hypothetical protein B5S31_g3848 [[Candida] boidinii]OWB76052.1 hypothetical protein B5S32_g201 [[Candida] boidinii]
MFLSNAVSFRNQKLRSLHIHDFLQSAIYINFLAVRFYSKKAPKSTAKAKTASSSRWLNRAQNDPYSRQAKEFNLRSRAAFKLLQIDDKFSIFKSGQNVVDLGFAPGAWSQVAVEKTNKTGKILGVDILPCQPPNGVSSMQANILSKQTHDNIRDFFNFPDRNNLFMPIKVEIDENGNEIGQGQGQDRNNNGTLNHSEVIVEGKSYLESELEIEAIELEKLGVNESKHKDNSEEESLGVSDSKDKFASEEGTELQNIKINKNKNKIPQQFPVDVVLSDMCAPFLQINGFHSWTTNNPYIRMANTTGMAFKDHVMSMDLCDAALILAIDLLRPGGSFVIKFFTGVEDSLLETRLEKSFNVVHRYKPKATRDESKECYFVCLNKKKDVDKRDVFKISS